MIIRLEYNFYSYDNWHENQYRNKIYFQQKTLLGILKGKNFNYSKIHCIKQNKRSKAKLANENFPEKRNENFYIRFYICFLRFSKREEKKTQHNTNNEE